MLFNNKLITHNINPKALRPFKGQKEWKLLQLSFIYWSKERAEREEQQEEKREKNKIKTLANRLKYLETDKGRLETVILKKNPEQSYCLSRNEET